jgi:hypothetical protein
MGYQSSGVKSGGLPVEYVKRFVDEYGIKVFIETGTAGGDSVRAAADIFETCHTIEIVDGRTGGESGVHQFPENVYLHIGDSGFLLKEIAKPYKGNRIVFWLDAHWSENYESEDKSNECPLIREIQGIKGHDALVLIDDARLFLGPHPWPCDYRFWPQFQDVFNALRDSFPRHRITVIDDYIIAVPDYMDDTFRIEWWDRFKIRYPEDSDRVKAHARHLYETFLKFIE